MNSVAMEGKIKRLSLISTFLFLIYSCSTPPVSRPSAGMRAASAPSMEFSGVRKKVALLTFFNESPYGGDELAINATEEIRRELARSGHFIMAPQAEQIFGSAKEIYAAGGGNLPQVMNRAKNAGINLLIFGRITEARVRERTDEIGLIRKNRTFSESVLELKVFDINSNKEILSHVFRGYAEDDGLRFFMSDREEHLAHRREMLRYSSRVAARQAIPAIVEVAQKMDWYGRVARIIGNKIYINSGRSSGLNVSDILKVMTEGQEIYDPETGALIGISRGEVKGTLEIIDYFGADGSIAILHSGGSVHEGDIVTLY